MDRTASLLVVACMVLAAGCSAQAPSPERVTVEGELVDQAKAGPVWPDVEGTSMRYLVSLPEGRRPGRTWPVMVVVTGSNSNFPVIAKGYHNARDEMPFVVVVPATVSSGSRINAERYSHLPEEEIAAYAEADLAAKLAYDVDGLERVLADVRRRFGGASDGPCGRGGASGSMCGMEARLGEAWRGPRSEYLTGL